jgi:hypothetical protein
LAVADKGVAGESERIVRNALLPLLPPAAEPGLFAVAPAAAAPATLGRRETSAAAEGGVKVVAGAAASLLLLPA